MEKHNAKFIREAIPSDIVKQEDGKLKVTWISSLNKEKLGEDLFDTVLLAIGRSADTKSLGLDKVGVKVTGSGKILAKENDQTDVPYIYALGDCV